MAANPILVEKVAPDGDILLIIGTPPTAKVLVSSATLKRTSAVFSAMLSPKFSEGQGVGSSQTPKEITLPDDDPIAISNMCNLTHGHRLTVKQLPKISTRVLKLAIVIDKYACVEVLYYQTQAILLKWLDEFPDADMIAYGQIAAAAYLLDQPRVFNRATKGLIGESSDDIVAILRDRCGEILPFNVFFAIEWKRNAAYNKISTAVPSLGARVCHQCITPGVWPKPSESGFIDQLCQAFKVYSWPPDFRAANCSALKAAEQIQHMGTVQLRVPNNCRHNGTRNDKVSAKELKAIADEVSELCCGLCLICVKDGRLDLVAKCSKHDLWDVD